jgi:hypothetical protein
MLTLKALQRVLGGVVSGGEVLCPGPGHGPRDRSMAVRLSGDDDFVVFSHAGDAWQECRDHVRERLGWPQWRPADGREEQIIPARRVERYDRDAVDAEAGPRPHTEDDLIRIARAAAIWNAATDPRGTLAEKYLNLRALVLTDDIAGAVLRFHPGCPWRDENTGATIFVPALIAAFRSIDDDTVTGIQRVALTSDGAKRVVLTSDGATSGRMMLGVVHRAAVKLDPAGETLAIGEGIETCLAARQMGHAPVWALGSAGAIKSFPVIGGVQCLRVLGEVGKASADAVRLCSRRWFRAGRRMQLVTPDDGCSDLNDELMMAAASGRRTA